MNASLKSSFQTVQDPSLEPTGEIAASIELFRAAMHAIAERETSRPLAGDWLLPARRRRRRAQGRMVLAWACAAALCFAVVPHSSHAPVTARSKVTNTLPDPPHSAISDTALLEQVDNEIAEPVPSSLAPLTELDSWNSTTSATESSLTQTEKKNVTQ
jgi:hypothetical protein